MFITPSHIYIYICIDTRSREWGGQNLQQELGKQHLQIPGHCLQDVQGSVIVNYVIFVVFVFHKFRKVLNSAKILAHKLVKIYILLAMSVTLAPPN